ncbi:uncharacterized protein JCM15063_005472 [Sporobolomyces koalae]|uniref:uncharacterized protein n=1 Tax=Sporobolomyces koalae TaxID=500713 RepID=UPI0031763F22
MRATTSCRRRSTTSSCWLTGIILSAALHSRTTLAQNLNSYSTAQSAASASTLEPRQLDSYSRSNAIPITAGPPSTATLSSSLADKFESVLTSLASTADTVTAHALRASHLTIRGLPGTSITNSREFEAIQSYLDCTAAEGEWKYDASGSSLAHEGKGLTVHKMDLPYASCEKRFYKGREPGVQSSGGDWDVRESLKYRFEPSSTCAAILPRQLRPKTRSNVPSRKRFCQLLAHKSLLLLGSTTQYSLHDLLLDYTTTEPQSCYGDLYCKEHALCGGILNTDDVTSVENWSLDERVYHRLPLPPAQPKLSARSLAPVPETNITLDRRQTKSLYPSSTYSTLLRYRRTDGLRPATAQTLPSYQHPFTALPEKNQQWLADSRRSDIVVLEKPPIPLPLRGHNETFDSWVYDFLEKDTIDLDDKVARLFEVVQTVTENVWLPELIDAIKTIRNEPTPPDQLVVYRSGWRTHYDCGSLNLDREWDSPGDGPGPLPSQPNLARLLYRSDSNDRLQPLETIFHNLQIVVQNRLARSQVLPRYGIAYLDLETPLSVWRSGLLGGSNSPSANKPGMRSSTSGDCHRYCFPSPGMTIETYFVGALERLFELGWANDPDSERTWVGDEFRNIRMRLRDREA